MGTLSKSELKEFKEQEQKKQAILHDLGLLATQSHKSEEQREGKRGI